VNSRRAVLGIGLVLCIGGGAAHADRGALTVDVGAGVALINVRAPYATGAPSQTGSSWTTSLGLRYAVTNALEFGAAVFYQPPTNFTHGNATVEVPQRAALSKARSPSAPSNSAFSCGRGP
jgi:hypothetical protein